MGLTVLRSTEVDTEEGRYCPKCKSDWRSGRIPPEYVAKGYYGEPTEEPRYFSRLIGVELPEKYDGISYWVCPDCGTRWDRWTGKEMDRV